MNKLLHSVVEKATPTHYFVVINAIYGNNSFAGCKTMLMTQESKSESSPDSPSSAQFLHVMPLQFPHAEIHLTSFFLQLHRQLLQSPLQLQLVNRSSSSGAIGSIVLELAHNHEPLPSIHSNWGPKTCSEAASSPGFGDRHRENAVQLHPL